jgi:serine O-acetyltransferase
MKLKKYTFYVKSDLFRYLGETGLKGFLRCFVLNPGFKYTVIMRTVRYLKDNGNTFKVAYFLFRMILRHFEFKYGISIPYNADIGPGLYIGHFGGIVVSYEARIGRNCNINHCVTVGATYGGKCPGVPTILDNVFLGPGCKIIGGITVGNDVAVGANCVVTGSVSDGAVVVGIPGKVISYKGSGSYVVNTVAEWSGD